MAAQPESTQPDPAPSASVAAPVGFRLRPAIGLRMVGFGLVWLGVLAVASLGWRALVPGGARAATIGWWALVALFAALVLVGGLLALDPRPRLRLDSEGFVNRTGRPAGVRAARWRDVTDVRRVAVDGRPAVVVMLADGRSSRILPRVLAVPAGEVEAQIRDRLNAAHGYRPLGSV